MHKQAKRLLISSASIGVTGGRQANKDMAWACDCVRGGKLAGLGNSNDRC